MPWECVYCKIRLKNNPLFYLKYNMQSCRQHFGGGSSVVTMNMYSTSCCKKVFQQGNFLSPQCSLLFSFQFFYSDGRKTRTRKFLSHFIYFFCACVFLEEQRWERELLWRQHGVSHHQLVRAGESGFHRPLVHTVQERGVAGQVSDRVKLPRQAR